MIFLSTTSGMAQDKPAELTCAPADRPDVELQADIAASQVQVARAAAIAVENLMASGVGIEPVRMAILLAEVVQAAAEGTAIDTSLAAAVVESAVAAAAAGVARATSASEEAYDSEVTAIADALHGLTAAAVQRAARVNQGSGGLCRYQGRGGGSRPSGAIWGQRRMVEKHDRTTQFPVGASSRAPQRTSSGGNNV